MTVAEGKGAVWTAWELISKAMAGLSGFQSAEDSACATTLEPSRQTASQALVATQARIMPTTPGDLGERFKPAVLKTADSQGSVSSNLTVPARNQKKAALGPLFFGL